MRIHVVDKFKLTVLLRTRFRKTDAVKMFTCYFFFNSNLMFFIVCKVYRVSIDFGNKSRDIQDVYRDNVFFFCSNVKTFFLFDNCFGFFFTIKNKNFKKTQFFLWSRQPKFAKHLYLIIPDGYLQTIFKITNILWTTWQYRISGSDGS